MTDEELAARLVAIEQRLKRLEADFAPYRELRVAKMPDGTIFMGLPEDVQEEINRRKAGLR